MSRVGKGVRKVNESIMQDGRTIIITEQDNNKLDWDRIPNGTLKIDPVTGQLFIKIQGEGGWIPAGLTYDGNLTIAKDARIVYEVFKIIRPNNGDGTFTYENELGERRTKMLTSAGKQTFELEKGSFIVKRNKIEAIINDTLHRSATSGGLTEIDETRISLEENLVAGTKVTLKYYLKVNIGNPYPRFFINENTPETADYGDFWLDISQEGSRLKWWNGHKWLVVGANGLKDVIGANMVFKGYQVLPGTSGRSVRIQHGADGEGVIFIDGVHFRDSVATGNITIAANSTGAVRTDTLYAEISENKLVYKIRTGSSTEPAGTCKIAEVRVPNGAATIAAGNIVLERKAYTIKSISDELHDATHLATPGTLIERDSSGRAKVAAPSAPDDIARKAEVDLKVSKSGDTMTGTLEIDGHGVIPMMTPVAATVSGNNYPVGITTFNSGSQAGYPITNSTVVNYKVSNNNFSQWIHGSTTTTRVFVRHWTGTAWSGFKEVRDLGETADAAYRGDRGKIAYEHSQVVNANPHEVRHAQLLAIQTLNTASTDSTQDKHLSNAQGKKWEDHVNTTDANPHSTKHEQLVGVQTLNTSSTTTAQDKHVSNAQGKKWEDHVNLVSNANPHGTRHTDLNNVETLNVGSTSTVQTKHLSDAQGKKWEDHVNLTTNANPHGTRHTDLNGVEPAVVTSTDTTLNKHVSNAQTKKWEDHVNDTANSNPHGTRHSDLNNVEAVNVSSTNTSQTKHVSDAQAKKWEDHSDAAHAHSEHLRSPSNTRLFVQSTRPTSGMTAGDIWIDTSVSYGTK